MGKGEGSFPDNRMAQGLWKPFFLSGTSVLLRPAVFRCPHVALLVSELVWERKGWGVWPAQQMKSLRASLSVKEKGSRWKSCSKDVLRGMEQGLTDGLDRNWNAQETIVLAQTCDASTQEAEAEGSLVGGQSGPNNEILSQTKSLRRII